MLSPLAHGRVELLLPGVGPLGRPLEPLAPRPLPSCPPPRACTSCRRCAHLRRARCTQIRGRGNGVGRAGLRLLPSHSQRTPHNVHPSPLPPSLPPPSGDHLVGWANSSLRRLAELPAKSGRCAEPGARATATTNHLVVSNSQQQPQQISWCLTNSRQRLQRSLPRCLQRCHPRERLLGQLMGTSAHASPCFLATQPTRCRGAGVVREDPLEAAWWPEARARLHATPAAAALHSGEARRHSEAEVLAADSPRQLAASGTQADAGRRGNDSAALAGQQQQQQQPQAQQQAQQPPSAQPQRPGGPLQETSAEVAAEEGGRERLVASATAAAAAGAAAAALVQALGQGGVRAVQPAEGERQVEEMLGRLQALPWRRVDVCFGATLLPLLSHQHIQVGTADLNSFSFATSSCKRSPLPASVAISVALPNLTLHRPSPLPAPLSLRAALPPCRCSAGGWTGPGSVPPISKHMLCL